MSVWDNYECEGQIKFDFAMTFKEKMENNGWHNVHDSHPSEPGTYRVYRNNGNIGKAYYCGNHTWRDTSGWEFNWWKEI